MKTTWSKSRAAKFKKWNLIEWIKSLKRFFILYSFFLLQFILGSWKRGQVGHVAKDVAWSGWRRWRLQPMSRYIEVSYRVSPFNFWFFQKVGFLSDMILVAKILIYDSEFVVYEVLSKTRALCLNRGTVLSYLSINLAMSKLKTTKTRTKQRQPSKSSRPCTSVPERPWLRLRWTPTSSRSHRLISSLKLPLETIPRMPWRSEL